MKKETIKRVPGIAVYLRTSDQDSQSPENSMAAQVDAINDNIVSRLALPIFSTYQDILTGTNYDRSGFQAMLEDARSGRFSHLAIYRVDRFGRDTAEGLQIANELRQIGVQVIPSSNPTIDITTPDGWLLFTFLLGLGEHEIGVMKDRVIRGMKAKVESGSIVARAPDGYTNCRQQIVGDHYKKWVEMDLERSAVIREAWDLLLTGDHSLDDICVELDRRGYLRRCGKRWAWTDEKGMNHTAAQDLSKIYHNPFYAGWVISASFEIKRGQIRHDAGAIVTDEEFDLAQKILEQHDHRKMKASHPYLLQGMLRTRRAGQLVPMRCTVARGKAGGLYSYYFTPPGKKGSAIGSQYFLCEDVDAQIDDIISLVGVDPGRVPELKARYTESVQHAIEDSIEQQSLNLRRQIADLREQEKAYARLWAMKKLSDTAYDELTAECRVKLLQHQTTLEQIGRGVGDRITNLDRALEVLTKIGAGYLRLEFKQRRRLLWLLFEYFVLDLNSGMIVEARLNPPFGYIFDNGDQKFEGPREDNTSAQGPRISISVPHGTPGGNRTHNLRIRSPLRYPIALRGHFNFKDSSWAASLCALHRKAFSGFVPEIGATPLPAGEGKAVDCRYLKRSGKFLQPVLRIALCNLVGGCNGSGSDIASLRFA